MRVIVVDDDQLVEMSLTTILGSDEEIEVVGSGHDGSEAVALYQKEKPDVVLMDIQMPVMNGYEAAQAIRSSTHPQSATIPIIAMTANAFAEDIKNALSAGMNAHIAKPIDPQKLYETLAAYIK